MRTKFTQPVRLALLTLLSFVIGNTAQSQSIGIYQFNSAIGVCPNLSTSVTSQPANAVFSQYSNVGATCVASAGVFNNDHWNGSGNYNQFTITPNSGYGLNLTSISFVQAASRSATGYEVRSSIDNYATILSSGTAPLSPQTTVVPLPAASFTSIGAVTFRLMILNPNGSPTDWYNDDVTVNGAVVLLPPDPANPTSNSPQCSAPGVTLTATGTPPAGVTWYWQTSATGRSTTSSAATYNVTSSGTYYLRAMDNITLAWSQGGGSATVTVTPDVTTPVFSATLIPTRCQGAGTVTYNATTTNSTGLIYSLDSTSLAANNSINSSTGAVTFDAVYVGNLTITATASGCAGPKSATYTVTSTNSIVTPTFTNGATSVRCQGAAIVNYPATSTYSTSITYALDATTAGFAGNSINSTTGAVTYASGWSGPTTITATAVGCNGPKSSVHTVTTTPTVGTPVFNAAPTTRCQGANTVTYSATASNSTGITYSIDGTSSGLGNVIDPVTGALTYVANYTGTTTITASAAGCNGPKTATLAVTSTPTVGAPVFTAPTVRCQAAQTVSYAATATSSTAISYALDQQSLNGGNTIVTTTGAVTYAGSWSGQSTITATATGCNGPSTNSIVVTTTPVVSALAFDSATSVRCQGAGTVTYGATATNTTGITYALDQNSRNAGNTINTSTGAVTYLSTWSGTSVITATAAGCSPQTANHTVTITPTVGTPVFTAPTTRCQGAGAVNYAATSTNNTGITYLLDQNSLSGNNTINATTGVVTYDAAWTGVSTITATATGCNGPKSSSINVTTTGYVVTPVFSASSPTSRCQGGNTATFTATATNSTSITYGLDATTDAFAGNSINATTGVVTFASGWTGTSTITATAAGCSGPKTQTINITTIATVGTPVFNSAPTTRCQGANTVIYSATATTTTGITYSIDATSSGLGNTINPSTGALTYVANYTGTTTITASAAGCNGPKTATLAVTSTATVGAPVFNAGPTPTRCQAAATVSYSATSARSTGMSYSLDAISSGAGNSIVTSTGAVTYAASWSGQSVITATATGCNGPVSSSYTVTTTPVVTTPVFDSTANSTRCQGSGTIVYSATANNTTGITYALDATSRNAGNTIITSTGAVTWVAGWSGPSIITATAAGCSPQSSNHNVTTTASVTTPIFTAGLPASRCQSAGQVTYNATASNSTGITYSLDSASAAAGNTINSSTGVVSYTASWNGTTIITASAAGCSGPKTATFTVTVNGLVGTPVFSSPSSTRCQAGTTTSYAATAANNTGITYNMDATTSGYPGNSINTTTGAITFSSQWTGNTTVTATATGCSGPKSASHIITTTPFVTTPVFSAGANSSRCQGAGVFTYTATASNSTSIVYSLDNASLSGGNTIDSLTGKVTFSSTWNGSAIITATANGCSGPKVASHNVTVKSTVGTPVFSIGSMSTRSQNADTLVYSATATNNTGIVYALDSVSLSKGNSIYSTTGTVIWAAGFSGFSTITATASGCNGPVTSTHIVVTNPNTVTTPLYLSDPSQSLDRVDPIASNDITIATSVLLRGTHPNDSARFILRPALCSPLNIKAGSIVVSTYIAVTTGAVATYPNVTATLKSGAGNILTITNPLYNSSTGILTWMGTLNSDRTISAGDSIILVIENLDNTSFTIQFDARNKPSRIDLPVSSYINIESLNVYDAPYPGGAIRTSTAPGNQNYVRAVVSDPFGYTDITGLNIAVSPGGSTGSATVVDSSGCTKTYEYMWTSSSVPGNYSISATSLQGLENKVTYVDNVELYICTTCPPVALDDSASGAGGAPLLINVLNNDFDPNGNLDPSSLTIITQPLNGDAVLSGNKIIYIPNGTFAGIDTFYYKVCDLSSPTSYCDTAMVIVKIDPTIVDPCTEATQSHVFYLPYPETDVRTALLASSNLSETINNVRTVISLKMPYPNMTIVWDHWEDGYEENALNPVQLSTLVWGDGNPYNGIAPGYTNDVIPAGGSIVIDNTIPVNPRGTALFFDGRDKVSASGQVSVTQVCGEPSRIGLQCMKTDVASTNDFGKSFTVPVGTDFPSQDFAYTALFIRASENNTTVGIDKDNNGTFETTTILNEGQSYLLNGGVKSGAKITSSAKIGVDLHFGGVDSYSSREVPLYPASWYSNTYYTPVPTTGAATTIKDTNAVFLYNSLNRSININWSSGIPSSGTINVPAKTVVRFPLALSQTAAYKFQNPTGESFTAIQVCDSYTPGGGGNSGSSYDWAFNLIAEDRLTTYSTTAWAPGSTDGTRNDNPVWVTPAANTTIYVKYNGDLTNGGLVSPCGLHYDVSYALGTLKHKRLLDVSDNDQSGLAVYTCDGTKLAVVYGSDASTAVVGNPSWDVGSTIRPYCAMKLIFANDDYAYTITDNPVTIPILKNDYGFSAVIDPSSVITNGLLQPKHGVVTINANGTILYTPDPGYQGVDTFEYSVCSTPSPIVCDKATVYVRITSCPTPQGRNIIGGQVFLDKSQDGINNDGGEGVSPAKVYLYNDGNCNGTADANELTDSISVDNSGMYQFVTYPEKTISDNFDGPGGTKTCATGNDGNAPWLGSWTDAGDPSTGYCVTPASTLGNTDAEIVKDGAFGYAIRLKDNNVSATRSANLTGASYAFLTFSYRRATTSLQPTEDIIVQASSNGTTFSTVYTISGDGTSDLNYVTVYNQDISAFAGATTYVRFLTGSNVDEADSVFIDNVVIKYIKYPQCYITKLSPSSVPQAYYVTTQSEKAISVAGTGSCYAPYDFGIAPLFTVLPVTAMPLSGKAKETENLLTWTTESERSTHHFEIENSINGSLFTSIASVPAKGNTSVKSYYSYSHINPSKVANMYRIKLVDVDGKTSFSNTITLKPGTQPITMAVMPNPFDNSFAITVNVNVAGKATIAVIDLYGKIVKTLTTSVTQGYNRIALTDLGSLPSGTYVVQLKNGDQTAFSKIVKAK